MEQLLEVLTSDDSLYSLFEWELHVIPDFIIKPKTSNIEWIQASRFFDDFKGKRS